MTTPLERIHAIATHMDAHDARQARDIFDARLRELSNAFDKACLEVYEGITKDTPSSARREGAELQPPTGLEPCSECGIISANHALDGHHVHVNPQTRAAGLELQAGLEEAVRRERAQLVGPHNHGNIGSVSLDDCPACETEEQGHVGYTDEF